MGAPAVVTTYSKTLEDECKEILVTRYQSRQTQLDALREVIDRRWDEPGNPVTLTRILGMRRRYGEVMHYCMLRARGQWVRASNEIYDAPPARRGMVKLRSLRKDGEGKCLPVPYKTGLEEKPRWGEPLAIVNTPETDPETGIFYLPIDEALKILKYYGKGIVTEYRFPLGARLNDRTGVKVTDKPRGRRWLVEEPDHTYVEASPESGTGPMVIE